jgi:hypothetical protein
MKTLLTGLALGLVGLLSSPAQTTNQPPPASPKLLTPEARQIIDAHRQLYQMSCIPSGVEMVLKLSRRAGTNYFDQQKAWKNRADGNFRDFDRKTINGVTFHQQFNVPRNEAFPLEKLFATIDRELEAGRYVIISLNSGNGWHMWIICDRSDDGEYTALSKEGAKTVMETKVKERVRRMKGTDILTYEITH